jgi:transcription elongation factor GreA-like protein/transcription elongation GreA/GreB family factor
MMSYVEEFRSRLAARDYNKVLVLWQEYCENDEVDSDELVRILLLVKQSDFAKNFGQYVEAILPLVMTIAEDDVRLEVLRHIYDLETSNSQALWDLAMELLKAKFGTDPRYQDKLRLVGLRTKENFQGALSNFLLLNHFAKGNYVFHNAGWGVGEIVDFSFLREQVSVEFENLQGSKRDISFKNAFRSLSPLPKDHFYVLRFASPEVLEQQAKEDAVGLVSRILKDLGPKSASEIKELLSGFVLDEEAYVKWWQGTRTKLKKDGHIEAPKNPKDQFSLRKALLSLDERIERGLHGKITFPEILGALYTLVRDFPDLARNEKTKKVIIQKAKELLSIEGVGEVDELQVYFFIEQVQEENEYGERIRKIVMSIDNWEKVLSSIDIIAMRKRLLQAVQQIRPDWEKIFLFMMQVAEPAQLRDYALKELSVPTVHPALAAELENLISHPELHPEGFLWYFQKVISEEAPLLTSQRDKERLLESFLLLLATMEQRRDEKDFVKKMLAVLTGQRFLVVRNILKGTDLVYAREFLLIASKCHSLRPQDQTTLRSLVEVVHGGPSADQGASIDQSVIWTTEAGYERVREKIRHIGVVEVVENAKEIEAARAHGDLRENSEFKFAMERRSRLQNELKVLSDQFHRARIITADDISTESVGIGARVLLKDPKGESVTITILGPWDAAPEQNILSTQSKLAQSLLGKKVGNRFEFRGEPMTIVKIESYLSGS